MAKRADILVLFDLNALPSRIINEAASPPADDDFNRRLRHWAADCALRVVPLLPDERKPIAITLLRRARSIADGGSRSGDLNYDALFATARQSLFSPEAEAALAVALTTYPDVFLGSNGAAWHARRAIQHANLQPMARRRPPDIHETRWQVARLKGWMT
jgi:hypothetical protein